MAGNATKIIADAQALDRWLRDQLGRQMTLALVRANADDGSAWSILQAEIARYQEVRLASLEQPASDAVSLGQTSSWEATLRQALQQDVDALLVWYAAEAETGERAAQLREITQAGDALNVFDRMTLALIGPGTTRATARALGFEDGFALEAATAQEDTLAALITLAQATFDAEAYRRRGSSPPCYL